MTNLHVVLLGFADPFMDANYTKVTCSIILLVLFLCHLSRSIVLTRYSTRILHVFDVKEETRVNATSDEAMSWETDNELPEGDIYYVVCSSDSYTLQGLLLFISEIFLFDSCHESLWAYENDPIF